MQRYWTKLAEYHRGGYDLVLDKTWEDCALSDVFDDNTDPQTGEPYNDVQKWAEQIDKGELDWFMLRCRVFVNGLEMADACIGGLLYEDAKQVLEDGIAEDLIADATYEAIQRTHDMARKLTMLSLKHSEVDHLTV